MVSTCMQGPRRSCTRTAACRSASRRSACATMFPASGSMIGRCEASSSHAIAASAAHSLNGAHPRWRGSSRFSQVSEQKRSTLHPAQRRCHRFGSSFGSRGWRARESAKHVAHVNGLASGVGVSTRGLSMSTLWPAAMSRVAYMPSCPSNELATTRHGNSLRSRAMLVEYARRSTSRGAAAARGPSDDPNFSQFALLARLRRDAYAADFLTSV